MNREKNNKSSEVYSHRMLKKLISSHTDLSYLFENKKFLKEALSNTHCKIDNLPKDLIALAVANECVIDSYSDMHNDALTSDSLKRNKAFVSLLNSLF